MNGGLKAFGIRLKLARQAMGLTQTDFGDLAGVSKNSQSAYEQGTTPPTIEYLLRLADHGVDIGSILASDRATEHGETQLRQEPEQSSQPVSGFDLRLRCSAIDHNLSQADLCRIAGISKQSMSRYWNGERLPPADKLFPIADALRVPARWLISGANVLDEETYELTRKEMLAAAAVDRAIEDGQTFDEFRDEILKIIERPKTAPSDSARKLRIRLPFGLSFTITVEAAS